MDSFVVPRMSPASQYLEQLAEAISGIPLGGFLQLRDHLVVSFWIGLISIHRIADANNTTGSALNQPILVAPLALKLFFYDILQDLVVQAQLRIHLL